GKFAPIPWVYGEIVRKIAAGEIVRILVNSAAHQARAVSVLQRCGVDLGRVEFFRFPTNRGWTRDFGPMFVLRDGRRPAKGSLRNNEDDRENKGRVAIVRFRFNGWAKYPNWQKDDAVPERVARALKLGGGKNAVALFHARADGGKLVLEGGSFDVNARGALWTTEECLLD